jgi:alkyl sulfatase BDS1-like metallo-beta-lactamase superfamily hydrolase
VSHNTKAQYQKHLGWFDANPANLNPLPPAESSKKYVEFMGGADAILAKARESFEKGEYRWVAQVVNHVVFADPNNQEARELQADALEQLGYRAESGPWRNFYLTGALELRQGVQKRLALSTVSPDILRVMTPEMFFDFLSIRLNGPKAVGKTITINVNLTDIRQRYLLTVNNAVLNQTADKHAQGADATLTLTRGALYQIL